MKNYKKIDHFESIVMKCTQEQFEEIRETLEKYGCVIDSVYLFKYHDYLTNRWCGKNKNIANHCNAHSSYFSKKLYEDWNAKTFLKACGIVEREPTTKVRNSVLLKLAENNSYSEEILKKECPKLFESEKDKLIKEALKRGFKKGVVVKNHQGIFVLDELDIVFSEKYNYGIWTKQGIGIWLFINDVWAEIIETPTDIITIVEKYGKDKVISLIEKM